MGVCTKERNGMTAEVLMATPCTESLGCEIGGTSRERESLFFYEKNGKVTSNFFSFFLCRPAREEGAGCTSLVA